MSKIGSLHSCSKENFKILFGCSHITLFGGVKSKQSGSFLNRKASIKNDCFYVNWLFSVCLSSGPTRRRCYLNERFYWYVRTKNSYEIKNVKQDNNI